MCVLDSVTYKAFSPKNVALSSKTFIKYSCSSFAQRLPVWMPLDLLYAPPTGLGAVSVDPPIGLP